MSQPEGSSYNHVKQLLKIPHVDKVRWGDANAMANRVMLHLIGYNYNLYTGIGDQLKTLNVHEIWNDLQLR